MTITKLSLSLFVVLLAALAFFVWPTPYTKTQVTGDDGTVRHFRTNRWTHGVEVKEPSGEWAEYRAPESFYDPVEAVARDAVDKMEQARTDIQKMHDVTQDVINNGTTPKK